MTAPGVYVIEVGHGVVKVGQSTDTDRRIATHIRHARGLGADPYRWRVLPCPADLLRPAERAAHEAVTALGGVPGQHTPEVFTGVFYNAALAAAERAVGEVVDTAAALGALRRLDAAALDELAASLPREVALVVRRAVAS